MESCLKNAFLLISFSFIVYSCAMENVSFIQNNTGIDPLNADELPFLEMISKMDTSDNILRVYHDGSLYYLFGAESDGNWLKINQLTDLGMSLLSKELLMIREKKYDKKFDADKHGIQVIKFCLDKNYFEVSAPIAPGYNNTEINELQHIINRNLKKAVE